MAIQLIDSFDSYAVVGDLLKEYGSYFGPIPPVYSTTAGKFGGGSVSLSPGSNVNSVGYIGINSRALLFNGSTAVGAAFWFKSTALQATHMACIGLKTSGGNVICSIGPDYATGVMNFFAGFDGGPYGNGTINVCDGLWHWIEVVFKQGQPANSHIWVDGILDATCTLGGGGIWAAGIAADSIQLVSPGNTSTNTWRFDDLIVCDDIGGKTTPANFPLGPSRIVTKRPTSDSSVNFTTSTGANHFGQVNEAVGSNTQYVQSSTSGQKDLYGYGALGFSPSRITAAVVKSYVENPGAGTIQFKNACKSNLTETDSAAITAPPAAQIISTEYNVDPNTAAAWTQSGLDAALFGALVV